MFSKCFLYSRMKPSLTAALVSLLQTIVNSYKAVLMLGNSEFMCCLFRACLAIVWINTVNSADESFKLGTRLHSLCVRNRVRQDVQKIIIALGLC